MIEHHRTTPTANITSGAAKISPDKSKSKPGGIIAGSVRPDAWGRFEARKKHADTDGGGHILGPLWPHLQT